MNSTVVPKWPLGCEENVSSDKIFTSEHNKITNNNKIHLQMIIIQLGYWLNMILR